MIYDDSVIWFLAGLVLVLLEFAVPGVILVFIGLGAWLAALTTWMGWTPSLGAQAMVFAVGSVTLILTLRRFFQTWFLGISEAGSPELASDEMIHAEVLVVKDIPMGSLGKIEFRGVHWNAMSSVPVFAGSWVSIVSREGLNLRVRPLTEGVGAHESDQSRVPGVSS